MELKLMVMALLVISRASSNRTFMELKRKVGIVPCTAQDVLIVPLWN